MRERSRAEGRWGCALLLGLALGCTRAPEAGAPAAPGPGERTAPSDWETAEPEAVGIDGALLARLADDLRDGVYPNVHGLLVVREGRLAFEEYFEGPDERRGEPLGVVRFDAHTLHDARSITKSVVSMLVGAALAEGAIGGVDVPVLDLLPAYADLRTPELARIELRHLLSMTSGLEWDEGSRPYGDPLNSETAMDRSPDPCRYVLERRVVAPPGTRWEYSGGDTALLAAVVEAAVGTGLARYAERVVFGPLGIERYEWLKYPGGVPIAASGLRLLPRDMARLGLLYLDGGRWRGEQVVPAAWVRDSLSPQAVVSDRPLGFQRYGYQWWLGTGRVGDERLPWSAAVGWGGQRILLVPSCDLVVVLTAGLYGDPRQTDVTFEVLLDRVLPAVTG